jgi:tRNA 2-thiocytidine biosynthesis protein TtcA
MTAETARNSINKLVKRLQGNTGRAITDFNMIGEGDRVMVCLSGGKDSFTLLDVLMESQKRAPVHFDLIAVNLDQKQPDFPEHVLPEYTQKIGIPFHVIEQDTYSVVKRVIPEGKTSCGLCSRLRRGALYRFARENGITRIALGHHRDDIIETLFLNLFNGGRLKAMPPKLLSDNGEHVVIRPLAYCSEEDIIRYADSRRFPIIPCNLCGSQPNLQRQAIKEMLTVWKKQHPGRIENIFRAIGHVSPSQLADHQLFNFINLGAEQPWTEENSSRPQVLRDSPERRAC